MVPTADAGIGASALATKPAIEQVFIGDQGSGIRDQVRLKPDTTKNAVESAVTPFERKLYVIRKRVEHLVRSSSLAIGEEVARHALRLRTIRRVRDYLSRVTQKVCPNVTFLDTRR